MKLQKLLPTSTPEFDDIDGGNVEKFLDLAIQRDVMIAEIENRKPMTREQIIVQLATGKQISYGTDWYELIRDGDAVKPIIQKPVETVTCDCGHTVEKILVMNASFGTACPDCYDRMSE